MATWDISGNCSRPICRRILEEAGIPREMFGREKKVTLILFFHRNSLLSEKSLADFAKSGSTSTFEAAEAAFLVC